MTQSATSTALRLVRTVHRLSRGSQITTAAATLILFAFPGATRSETPLPFRQYVAAVCGENLRVCDDGNTIAKRMLACLKLPPDEPSSYYMLARVLLKDGSAEFVSIGFPADVINPSNWQRSAGEAVSNAIVTCEPYEKLSGPAIFIIDPVLVSQPKS